jgi:F-type H+-transporting ATPase subunit gamma
MEDIERIEARLANIRTVEPILDALRTISIGSWQIALRQQERLHEHNARLRAVLPALIPHLPTSRQKCLPVVSTVPQRIAALVIGSERGLCGRFNAVLVEGARDYLHARAQEGCQVELLALGTRLVRLIRRRGWAVAWSGPLSVTSLPSFATARELCGRWWAAYEEGSLDAVDLLYNAYRRAGVYVPTILRLIPPELPAVSGGEVWPPPIIETDPLRLYQQAIAQQVSLHLYQVLLESAAAEHSTRFQLMESATQNAQRLIVELSQFVQSARRQAITREVQELAVGAGLLGPPLNDF